MSVTEKEIEAGKMGCGDGEAPGEHQHNWEEEQLKRFLLTEAKKKKKKRASILGSHYIWLTESLML